MATQNNGKQGWTTLEQYVQGSGVATGIEKPNDVGDPDYVAPIDNLVSCPIPPPSPVTVHTKITRDNSPYVEGNLGLKRNGGSEELITFEGTTDSALGFLVGETLTAHSFHYHLATRWPDDASLTMTIKEGGFGGTVIYTNTGGAVNVADVNIHDIVLTTTEYSIEITTTSSDSSLKIPVMGYDLVNNSAVSGNSIKVGAIDTTNGLYMLGESPSGITLPNSGSPKAGSYNMKDDANTQTIVISNNSLSAINVALTTVPQGGVYNSSFTIPASTTVNKTGVDKQGFKLTVT